MSTYVATVPAHASPNAVLDVLTDPDAARRWAPATFRVRGLHDDTRLAAGSRVRVIGEFAGRPVGFDVAVHEAHDGRLELTAEGPVTFDVRYDVARTPAGSEVTATVAVRPRRGLVGKALAGAFGSLLAGGALEHTVRRIAREADAAAVTAC